MINKTNKNRVFTEENFNSNNGFNTAIWGNCMWLFLHTISFNYPVKPTEDVKKNYKSFILNLQNILPCKMCRENLKNNFKTLPLKDTDLENRTSFSRYIYTKYIDTICIIICIIMCIIICIVLVKFVFTIN